MSKEIWKDIRGFKGFYQASNNGNIKRLRRKVNVWFGKRTARERIMTNSVGGWGYVQIELCKNNVITKIKVHRIVAKLFIPNPKNKPCVNHKNGIKTDNRDENLEWVTYFENNDHAIKNNLRPSFYKKIIDTKTGVIYNGLKSASNFTGIHIPNLSSMLHGRRINRTNLKYT